MNNNSCLLHYLFSIIILIKLSKYCLLYEQSPPLLSYLFIQLQIVSIILSRFLFSILVLIYVAAADLMFLLFGVPRHEVNGGVVLYG